jgi:tetratricopeptide (TPR) repeat protein
MTQPDLLSAARRLEKSYQWEQAVDRYRRYLDGRDHASNVTACIGYARCLRNIGDTAAAADILTELIRWQPGDENVLLEQAALYESLMDWSAARKTLQELVRADPEKAKYYFRLGRAQVGLAELEAATDSYQSGLTQCHTIPYDDVVSRVQSMLPKKSAHVRSTYSLAGGLDNVGALIHDTGDSRYFTKIVQAGKSREQLYYEGLLQTHRYLSDISPVYIGSQRIDGLLYMTMELLNPNSAPPTFADAVAISRTIQTVRHADVSSDYANPDYKFQLDLNTPSVVKGFAHVHERRYNRQLFETLHRVTPTAADPGTADQIVHRLENIVMRNHLHILMSPPEHYTLLHGDFKPANIMSSAHGFRVIDWQGFRLGPRFLDIAKYAVHAKIPYPDVREKYLFTATADSLSTVEQIFFLYAYVLMVLLTSMRKSLSTGLASYIEPALADMEAAVIRLQTDEFASFAQLTADRIERLENDLADKESQAKIRSRKLRVRAAQARDIENENKLLSATNRRVKHRLTKVEHSTSWRLTAPLRRAAAAARRHARQFRK